MKLFIIYFFSVVFQFLHKNKTTYLDNTCDKIQPWTIVTLPTVTYQPGSTLTTRFWIDRGCNYFFNYK
jgi:hypothetical protein